MYCVFCIEKLFEMLKQHLNTTNVLHVIRNYYTSVCLFFLCVQGLRKFCPTNSNSPIDNLITGSSLVKTNYLLKKHVSINRLFKTCNSLIDNLITGSSLVKTISLLKKHVSINRLFKTWQGRIIDPFHLLYKCSPFCYEITYLPG